jgi:poly(hydroxyalkanoate) granule-associated protein
MPRTKTTKTQLDATETAKKIWLAGVGALTMAEEEGSKLFKVLVDKGKKNESMAEFPVKTAKTAQKKVEGMWDKIGQGLEERVQSALHRIGVPTRDEIAGLSRRVEAMNRTLNEKPKRRRAAAKRKTATAEHA